MRRQDRDRKRALKRAECYTFFHMVGALDGQCVMDLACGFGFYTRLLKQRGAAQVVGVNVSPESCIDGLASSSRSRRSRSVGSAVSGVATPDTPSPPGPRGGPVRLRGRVCR